MPESSTQAWSGFAPQASQASELLEVSHVTHIEAAWNVLYEGRINARPVYDDSRLNTTRTHVVWLSPNKWHWGSMYGSVSFRFSWPGVISGLSPYWVGVMRKCSSSAEVGHELAFS